MKNSTITRGIESNMKNLSKIEKEIEKNEGTP